MGGIISRKATILTFKAHVWFGFTGAGAGRYDLTVLHTKIHFYFGDPTDLVIFWMKAAFFHKNLSKTKVEGGT